jgi:hypothetical protein
MKVSIGSKIFSGPYGGGNSFVVNLVSYLESNGCEVVFDLKDSDIDIILLTNPILDSESSSFNHHDINFYTNFINKNSIVIHRINECDERKGTNGVNKIIEKANQYCDYTIFVSDWIRQLYISKYKITIGNKVILGGSNSKIFYPAKNKIDLDNRKNLVTHHWSSNKYKGLDIYLRINKLLDLPYWKNKITFTYIGNITESKNFYNTKIIEPMEEKDLGPELRKFDGYITASRNEPSGNHHVEAALSGLPILYLESGGIPEYCSGYGLSFNSENFESKLEVFLDNLVTYKENLKDYPYDSKLMSKNYLITFKDLLKNKKEIINTRKKNNKYKVLLLYLANKIIKVTISKKNNAKIKIISIFK